MPYIITADISIYKARKARATPTRAEAEPMRTTDPAPVNSTGWLNDALALGTRTVPRLVGTPLVGMPVG